MGVSYNMQQDDNKAKTIKLLRKVNKTITKNVLGTDDVLDLITHQYKGKKDFDKFKQTYDLIDVAIEYPGIDSGLYKSVKEKLATCLFPIFSGRTNNFSKLEKNLFNDVKNEFKRRGLKLEDFLPSDPWYRKLSSIFGSKKQECYIEDNSNWMSKLDHSKTLDDIIIPGAHDSGSYSMFAKSKVDIAGKLAQTQIASIEEQLQAGIRYFDWRIKESKNCLVFKHGPIKGTNVLVAVKQLCDFLRRHPSEFVIVRLKAEKTKNKAIKKFFESTIVKNELLPLLLDTSKIKNSDDFRKLKIQDILKKGHGTAILMTYDKDINENNRKVCISTNMIRSNYKKETRTSEDNETMINAEIEDLKNTPNDGLHYCSPLNTSSAKKVLRYYFEKIPFFSISRKPKTNIYPLENSKKNVETNVNKLLDERKKGIIKLNSIQLDGVGTKETQNCINKIIEQNYDKVDLTNSKNNG